MFGNGQSQTSSYQKKRIDVEQLDSEEAETSNLEKLDGGSRVHFASIGLVSGERKLEDVVRSTSLMRPSSLRIRQAHLARQFMKGHSLQNVKKNDGNRKANAILGTIEKKDVQPMGIMRNLKITSDSDDESDGDEDEDDNNMQDGELLPLCMNTYGSIPNENTASGNQTGRFQLKKKKKWFGQELPSCCVRRRRHHGTRESAGQAIGRVSTSIFCSFFVLLGLPLLISAWILFYYFSDPFVPVLNPNGTKVTLSWFLNFLARQIMVLEVSRIIQFIVLDWILLGCKVAEKMGSYATLVSIQSHGFPFLLIVWACLDFAVLRGQNDFMSYWYKWTGFVLYSEADSAELLFSILYLRMLFCSLLIGIFTVIKRSILSLRFGKRLMTQFKPRMEKLLADIVLMNELAILADQVESVTAAFADSKEEHANVKQQKAATLSKVADSIEEGVDIMKEKVTWSDMGADEDNVVFETDDGAPLGESIEKLDSKSFSTNALDKLKKNSSGEFVIKEFLDPWEDPVDSINNKNREATIDDVLKFQRALGYMDESHPFGAAFGPAANRDQAIASYHNVYVKLAKFDGHENPVVNFDVIALIANDSNGVPIHDKLQAVKKLFRPDARNELPLLAFVQSCDAVYKRLRYFRASVNNSSAIDKVLQDMINGIYWFIMIFLLLELLNLDPWTLLVSITSLLVSVSFAMGSSVSNYIEGLLLIAMRRPYDLGDRVLIVGSEAQDKPLPNESFFVEDINLLTTTVRYAKTNEVSTINNFSISKSRIINLQRSQNAILDFEYKFKDSVLQTGAHIRFREQVEQYISDHPRIWDRLLFMRHDEIDNDWGNVTFHLAIRHCSSWQNAGRIMLHRADILRFMYDKGMDAQILWETPIQRRQILDGGTIENDIITPRKHTDWPLFANSLLPTKAS